MAILPQQNPQERIQQLEWEVEKLLGDKNPKAIDYSKLRSPFDAQALEWRVQRAGSGQKGPWAIIVPYINARMIIDRLDEVCGPQSWRDSYAPIEKGFLCTIEIQTENGWVGKSDGASATDIEGTKGGISDAFKRAAVKWGIGRYLYDFETVFADIVPQGTPGAQFAKTKDFSGKEISFYWKVPQTQARS